MNSKEVLNQLARAWVASGYSPAAWRTVLESRHLALVAIDCTRGWRGNRGADIVQDLMLAWSETPPSFAGRSEFSTYLFSVLKSRFVDSLKSYVPSAVSRHGQHAKEAWKLLGDGMGSASVVDFLADQMPRTEATKMIEVLRRVRFKDKTPVKRTEELPFSQIDWDGDRETTSEVDPLEAFAQADLIKLVIERLGPDWRDIVREYFLERTGSSLMETGKAHGVANAQYEWAKLSAKLKKDLE